MPALERTASTSAVIRSSANHDGWIAVGLAVLGLIVVVGVAVVEYRESRERRHTPNDAATASTPPADQVYDWRTDGVFENGPDRVYDQESETAVSNFGVRHLYLRPVTVDSTNRRDR